ncbi:VOC family protein [Actinoplanes sp. NPDC026619]|uniref:VOC family protein n=1 Tax=Actinoplanes sp. NPDC026619 TaxID=3155798 RepID=UPI0033CDCC09
MEITGLGWLGTRTDRSEALVGFYRDVLGLRETYASDGFWVFTLPNGSQVEVFGEQSGKDVFDTGPVAGFAVRDLPAAVAELRAAGVEIVGEPGESWQHFRGPDGNIYELVAAVR